MQTHKFDRRALLEGLGISVVGALLYGCARADASEDVGVADVGERLARTAPWDGTLPSVSRVIRGERYTRQLDTRGLHDVRFENCIFETGNDGAIQLYGIGMNLQIVNCTFRNIRPDERVRGHGRHVIYLDSGLDAASESMYVVDNRFEGCDPTSFMIETKGDNVVIAGNRAPEMGIKIRYGVGAIVQDNACGEILVRGKGHRILNNSDSEVLLMAGQLRGDSMDRAAMRQAKRPVAEECYANGNRGVFVGKEDSKGDSLAALDNVLGPDQPNVRLGFERGTRRL